MKITFARLGAVGATALIAAGALAGCAGGGTPADTGSADGETIKVGLLLPETKTARYETFDRPIFEEKLTSLGDYEVVYSNADQDSAQQQQQAESAITEGVSVLVLDPVDAEAAVSIVASATTAGVPVISYDRLVASPDLAYYVSFDNQTVGELQGQTLIDGLQAQGIESGGYLMINGSPTDPNAADFKAGAHSVLDDSAYTLINEFDTPDWSPDEAQAWVASQLGTAEDLVAVYAANDGTAGGAIAAMKAASVDPWPLVTGQDAELAGIQRIVAGDQYMTIYKSIKAEAELAATIADQIARGEEVTGDTTTEDGVPATLLAPVAVTIDNIMDTVVADEFWSVAEICDGYEEACAAAGIE